MTEAKKQPMDYRPAWYEEEIEAAYKMHKSDPDADRSMEMLFGVLLVAVCAAAAGAFVLMLV